VPTRIIPGAISTDRLRALVISDAGRPDVKLEAVRGGKTPAPTVRDHDAGDPIVDQHLRKAKLELYLVEATGLAPGTDYQMTAGGKPVHFKTFPAALPPEGLSFALASCYYEAFGRDRDYLRALQAAPSYGPLAAKLLVGDNVYIDVGRAPGQARSGAEESVGRYLQYYWKSGYADVLSYLPTFCLWDDHEFWNNYPEWQVHLARSMDAGGREAYEKAAQATLRLFQAALNPEPAARGGLSYSFAAPPVSFFALDLRAGRTSMKSARPQMTSEAELAAFERWAAGLKAPGVAMFGQPLWIEKGNWMDYVPPDYAGQYARIWKALAGAPYDVLVLSGDVHHSRLLEFDVGRGRRVWELISSPACMIPTIESIAAQAFDVQDRGTITFPLQFPGEAAAAPKLAGYHFGTDHNNTISFFRLKPAGAGIDVTACFFDLVTKSVCKNQRPAVAAPLASSQPEWCQQTFSLKKRA
jgi:hypothetical protein